MELASVVRACVCAVASLGMMTSAGALIVLGERGTVWAVASALLVACASVFSVAITFGATKEQLALV